MSRRAFFLFLGVWILLSLACGNTPTKQPPAPTNPPPAEDTPATSAPETHTGSGHPARSFQEAENAVIKILATGTFASLESGRTVYNGEWIGSGFIIDPSGIAVTNNHVVAGAATLKVHIGGDVNKDFPARVLAASECMDLAVIQIEGGPFPVYLEWFTGPVNVGMDVYAAGYPGVGDHWQYTLTKGIISKTHEAGDMSWASLEHVYMHDARIRGGNSGGPLLTPDGKVVGVNYAGENVKDINLAIPAELAQPVVAQLRQGKPYRWLGINGQALVTKDGTFSGIWVSSVASGSPADRLGLQPADILAEIENITVAHNGTMKAYCDILASHSPQDAIKVKVLRLQSREILTGTLNTGQPLVVESTLDGGNPDGDGNTAGNGDGNAAAGNDYVVVTDDTQAIGAKVPAVWANQVDGTVWRTTWTKSGGSTYDVTAASVAAAPDIAAFNNLNGPGVWIVASRDFGRIGGYAQLLDGTQDWFASCSPSDNGDYNDQVYEGAYQLWERCGDNGSISSVVVAARPKQNPTAFLVLVVVNVDPASGNASEILGTILDSFDVIGALP